MHKRRYTTIAATTIKKQKGQVYCEPARLSRALSERLYLLDERVDEDEKALVLSYTYYVMGSKGTAYNVYLYPEDQTCECKDFELRQQPCKHILFILYRELRLKQGHVISNEEYWKAATEHWSKKQKQMAECKAKGLQCGQREYVGFECSICLEEMQKDDQVVYCKQVCGKSVHAACFTKWTEHHHTSNCVYCRSPMSS